MIVTRDYQNNLEKLYFGLPLQDLTEIYQSSSNVWQNMVNADVLVMGGTGFVGKWLTASLGYAIDQGKSISITVISRYPKNKYGVFNSASFKSDWLQYDLSKEQRIDFSKFTHIVNAATPSSALTGAVDPQYVFDSINRGNQLVLDSPINPQLRYLYLSSGAVTALEALEPAYDRNFCANNHLDSVSSAYSHGKRFAEEEINRAAQNLSLNAQSLRLFAFAGPGLPIDQHFAVGNFMKDAMQESPIEIKGNPNTQRSYMYPSDLTAHILQSLVSSDVRTRELGSKEAVTMQQLAKIISINTHNPIVKNGDTSKPISIYLPNSEDTLTQTIGLEESIRRWRKWLSVVTD